MRLHLSHVILASAALLGGCRRSAPHEVTNAFQWTDQIVAGGTLHLRDVNGEISVVPSPDGAVRVTGSKQWHRGRESDVRFVANRAGNDVYVCAVWGRRSRCDEHGYTGSGPSFWGIFSLRGRSDMRANFAVQVPAGVKVDILNVNGPVTVDRAAADVNIKAVNGSVTAHSQSGSIHVEGVNGSITASVDSLTTSGPFDFTTVNGSVHVTMPAAFQGRISLQTVTGRATTDFPLNGGSDRHNIDATIGTGSASVSLKTVNGSVQLLRKG